MNYGQVAAAQAGLLKNGALEPDGGAPALLRLIAATSRPVAPGATILDLGCGVGNAVHTLLEMGYDAHGVDLFEFWGSQAELYWKQEGAPTPLARSRLKVAEQEPYRLPYRSDSFDHVISCEVFEHVDDRAAVFAEIERVLKPGGSSVHIYPRRWIPLMEGHLNVPLSPLCKNHTYLKLAAVAGFRNVRQKGVDWRTVYRANVAQMEITHYPTRRQVLGEAQTAGLEARFAAHEYVARSGTGWTRLHRWLSRYRLAPLANLAAWLKLENMLVLHKPTLEAVRQAA